MTPDIEYGNLMQKLNTAQREAVSTTEGFVRVIAGAGSGKTRALSCRFAFLVNELGILPGNILCVTFTNKAANEMRQRIHNLTGEFPYSRRTVLRSSIQKVSWCWIMLMWMLCCRLSTRSGA